MSAKTMAEKPLIKRGTTLWSSHPDRLHPVEPLPGRVRTVERLKEATTVSGKQRQERSPASR